MARQNRRIKPIPSLMCLVMTPGQLALFGSTEPWQPSQCRCWPADPDLRRGCRHCRTCDTCTGCGRCTGRGCACECTTD